MALVISKYASNLKNIKNIFVRMKEDELSPFVQYIPEGTPKEDCEQKNLFFLDDWFCEENEIPRIKKLLEDIENLIKEYDDAN